MTSDDVPDTAPTDALATTSRDPHEFTRLRLDLAYDGSDFAGWARQPGLRTVEATLSDALARIFRISGGVKLTVAGRTDAGVHARAQVAHSDVPTAHWHAVVGRSDRRPEDAAVTRLAGVLPPDLVVFAVTEVPRFFDARFSALRRRYCYRISDCPDTRDPRTRNWVLWRRRELDVSAMNRAAQQLLGEHDWVAYCKPRTGASTVRTLEVFRWERRSEVHGGYVEATVQADAFCHNMVRALVGASLVVGEGRQGEAWMRSVLESGERDSAVTVVPAHGLTLEEVQYPESDAELAARERMTRAVRGPVH